jgi:hypothetical protein
MFSIKMYVTQLNVHVYNIFLKNVLKKLNSAVHNIIYSLASLRWI